MGLHFWPRGVAAMLALAFLPSTGCSWLGVSKPPNGPIPATPPVKCTSEAVEPVADTVVAGLLVVGGVAVIVAGSRYKESGIWESGFNEAGEIGGAVLVAAGVPFAFSAGYGYSATAECRQLKETQLSCVSGVEDACRSLEEGRKPPQHPPQVPPASATPSP